ncbi:hypothetical protein N008_14750 [Hymenobacter sp. APR13]|nr:hypothetical protein N008_14750 [Hymenobacter sp. APR13]
MRGELYPPGLMPVATLPALRLQWAEVFEGGGLLWQLNFYGLLFDV